MTTTAKNDHFHTWFSGLGGNMVSQNHEELVKNLHQVPLQQVSTLKTDPQAIKEKYNHKFKQNAHY